MSYFKGFGTGSNSNGQFWYGAYGFLHKKNTGVGGRKNPLYGLLCNKPTYIYNKYKPGTGGVGAQNRANRRAKNARATVCNDHNCERFYQYLGLYPRFSYKSIDGYFPFPIPLYSSYNVTGNYKILRNGKFAHIIVFEGNGTFEVIGLRPINVNYIVVGGGGGGGRGSDGDHIVPRKGGGGGGGGGGGQLINGKIDLYLGNHNIIVGNGGNGGDITHNGNGINGGNSYIQQVRYDRVLVNANGGHGGMSGNTITGGNGGVSTGTTGSTGGTTSVPDGTIGGGGAGNDYPASLLGSGNGSKNNSVINYENLNVSIYGTGGGGGNSGENGIQNNGGRSGGGGGLTIGLGGIGHQVSNIDGEYGKSGTNFLGGGGGGAGGGGFSNTTNGIGGIGGNGGSGIVIVFFTLIA
jgi:hypothetical protein